MTLESDFFESSEDEPLSIESAVFQALGAASTCWENMENTGTFNGSRAVFIGDALLDVIRQYKEEEVV